MLGKYYVHIDRKIVFVLYMQCCTIKWYISKLAKVNVHYTFRSGAVKTQKPQNSSKTQKALLNTHFLNFFGLGCPCEYLW